MKGSVDKVPKLIGRFTTIIIAIFILLVSFQANASLIDRGNGLIYDSVLDITWMQDANYWGVDPTFRQFNFFDARDWADNLVFGGFDDWRLPKMLNPGPVDFRDKNLGCRGGGNICTDSEFGNLYFLTLGGQNGLAPDYSQTPFINVQSDSAYWMDTSASLTTEDHWYFWMDGGGIAGRQNEDVTFNYAWAVRDGDVGAVPLPATLALFGLGLAGLGWSRRKNS